MQNFKPQIVFQLCAIITYCFFINMFVKLGYIDFLYFIYFFHNNFFLSTLNKNMMMHDTLNSRFK